MSTYPGDGWSDEETFKMPMWAMWAHFVATCVLFTVTGLVQWLRSGTRVPNSVGFFHPFTSDGGGGERVLWCAVRETQRARPDCQCVIYTGDDASGDELARRAQERFGVRLSSPPGVVKLKWRSLVVPERYPVLTMVGQAIGGALLTAEAVTRYRPTVFFDTVGHAFGYPIARIAGCQVACYVHYPTISSDMIARVANRNDMYNNKGIVARSPALSFLKLVYYRTFACVYGLCGRYAGVVMANSSWTSAHLRRLWRTSPAVVYPPCDVDGLTDFALQGRVGGDSDEGVGVGHVSDTGHSPYVVSVGQFRPEKDHALQLRAWAKMKADEAGLSPEYRSSNPCVPRGAVLKIIGGCRGADDVARLESLRLMAKSLAVDDSIEFHVDVPYSKLRTLLGGASAGLHGMLDEHFGICVVEYMAAGAVPIAHDSAGPAMDIVVPAVRPEAENGGGVAGDEDDEEFPVGFLAKSVDGYADALAAALTMNDDERCAMADAARRRAEGMFCEDAFNTGFRAAMGPVLSSLATDRRDAILEAAGVRHRPTSGPRRRG